MRVSACKKFQQTRRTREVERRRTVGDICSVQQKKTASVEALATTSSQAHSLAYATFSHSHVLLVLRAMSSGAKWPIDAGSKHAALKKLQDPDGG